VTPAGPRLAVGIDLVQVSRIAESVASFGDRFLRRVFTDDELAYATRAPAEAASRLAARFAAKEAVKKALRLDGGVGWRDIEVRRAPDGACDIALHGAAAAAGAPADQLALSLSHEGDYATAVVVTYLRRDEDPT
jgi:holo-[acyl-carrier protein] synthase